VRFPCGKRWDDLEHAGELLRTGVAADSEADGYRRDFVALLAPACDSTRRFNANTRRFDLGACGGASNLSRHLAIVRAPARPLPQHHSRVLLARFSTVE